MDVQDLFEDQRRMPVPQLAAGLSVYGARGWPRRGCPRTPRWSERRGWPSGVRASASERCPRERQRAVSSRERQRAGELAQRASHTLRREHGLFLEKITIFFFSNRHLPYWPSPRTHRAHTPSMHLGHNLILGQNMNPRRILIRGHNLIPKR